MKKTNNLFLNNSLEYFFANNAEMVLKLIEKCERLEKIFHEDNPDVGFGFFHASDTLEFFLKHPEVQKYLQKKNPK